MDSPEEVSGSKNTASLRDVASETENAISGADEKWKKSLSFRKLAPLMSHPPAQMALQRVAPSTQTSCHERRSSCSISWWEMTQRSPFLSKGCHFLGVQWNVFGALWRCGSSTTRTLRNEFGLLLLKIDSLRFRFGPATVLPNACCKMTGGKLWATNMLK